jgi:hypothetical protein
MMQTDVKAASLSSTGDIYNGRTRVRGLLVIPGASAGSVVITDGSSGPALMTIATLASGTPFDVIIPGEGVLCYTGAYATLTNATLVAFYG